MSDTTLTPLGFLETERSEAYEVRQETQNRAPPVESKQEVQQRAEHGPKPIADIRLQFRVDPDTHDVTLFIIDRQSKKVIRAIPPEEFNRLSGGELVHLLT